MTNKKNILWIVFVLTSICTIALILIHKSYYSAVIIGILALFLIYGLWDLPPKHKTFSYMDQQRAFRAFDRSNILQYTLSSRSNKKRVIPDLKISKHYIRFFPVFFGVQELDFSILD
jgi:hypothetical protein